MNGEDTSRPRERWIGAAAAISGLGCLVLRPFVSAVLWAAILCFTTWPLFSRLDAAMGGRRTLAASLATLLLSAIIVTPVAILVSRLSGSVAETITATRKLIAEGPTTPPAWVASVPLVGGPLAAW